MTRDPEKRRAWARNYLKRNAEYAEKARERSRIAQAAKRANDPGFRHRSDFYKALVKIQGEEKCAICGVEPTHRRLQVDHDHTTDEVRGLLCARCNRMLGQAGDTEELLQKAIEYLRRRPYTGKFYAEYTAVPIELRYTKKGVA